MTLSTDTQTQHPASAGPVDAVLVRLEAYGVGIASAAALGALALRPVDLRNSGGPASAYARPTPALHGQTLAGYVAEHQSSRLTRQR